MGTFNMRPGQIANQRRSQRILLSVPVRVSGNRTNGTAFVEHTKTLIVNAHGALLLLQEPVREGQTLNVRNIATGEEVACRVADMSPGPNGVAEIGVEFAAPNARFWRVSFPPADWNARIPEAKRSTSKPAAAPTAEKDPVGKK